MGYIFPLKTSGLTVPESSCTELKTFILEESGGSWLKAINTDLIS